MFRAGISSILSSCTLVGLFGSGKFLRRYAEDQGVGPEDQEHGEDKVADHHRRDG